MSFEQWQISPAVREQYYGPALFDPWARWLVQDSPPTSGGSLIDLACATGAVARQLASAVGANGSVIGSDIDQRMLDFAGSLPQTGDAEIRWELGDMQNLPYSDDTFDGAYCAQGLQFVPNRVQAVSEVRRVLKPNAPFVSMVFRSLEDNPAYLAVSEAVKECTGESIPSRPFSIGGADDLLAIAHQAGMRDAEVLPHALDVTFPNPEIFIGTSTVAAIASLKDYADFSLAKRNELFERVSGVLAGILSEYTHNSHISFPTSVNRLRAHK